MLLSDYYDETASQDNELMHWAEDYGLDVKALMATSRDIRWISDPNPFVRVDLNKCIVCSRCVRACEEIQGRFVWGMAQRGFDTHLVAGLDEPMIEARCESCGACVAYCPTGALDSKLSFGLGTAEKGNNDLHLLWCRLQLDLNVKDGSYSRHFKP